MDLIQLSLLAVDAASEPSFTGLGNALKHFGGLLMLFAPGLIACSFAICAFAWITSGHSSKRVDWAKSQFKATCVCALVVGGYWVIKGLIITLASTPFA